MHRDRFEKIVLGVALIGLIVWGWMSQQMGDRISLSSDHLHEVENTESAAVKEKEAEKNPKRKLNEESEDRPCGFVHVAGEVKKPGMVSFREGQRIADAIQNCGGFTDEADPSSINLSKKLVDEMRIEVLRVGDPKSIEAESHGIADDRNGLIDLNAATLEELMSLPGIGEKRAKDIIARRSERSFQTVDELLEISGIGAKALEKIKDKVIVR